MTPHYVATAPLPEVRAALQQHADEASVKYSNLAPGDMSVRVEVQVDELDHYRWAYFVREPDDGNFFACVLLHPRRREEVSHTEAGLPDLDLELQKLVDEVQHYIVLGGDLLEVKDIEDGVWPVQHAFLTTTDGARWHVFADEDEARKALRHLYFQGVRDDPAFRAKIVTQVGRDALALWALGCRAVAHDGVWANNFEDWVNRTCADTDPWWYFGDGGQVEVGEVSPVLTERLGFAPGVVVRE